MSEENRSSPDLSRKRRVLQNLPWLFVLAPPLITWFLIENYRFEVPQLDDFGFIQFYHDAMDNGIDWNKAAGYHNEHRVLFHRLCYSAMFHLFNGDVRGIATVTFLIVLTIGACMLWLGRPVFAKYPRSGWIIGMLAMAALFTATQGYAWLWGFIYANHLPWLSVALGMFLLELRRLPAWLALVVPGLVAAAATLSFAMGLIAWLLIPGFALLSGRFRSRREAAGTLIPWFIAGIACSAYALAGMGGNGASGATEVESTGLKLALEDPLHAIWFCLSLLGNQLGQGTEFEFTLLAPMAGAVIFLVLVLSFAAIIINRGDREFRRSCAPWLTLGFGAILATGLITAGRLTPSGILTETSHYVLTTCYGTISAVFLLPLMATKFPRLRPILPVTAVVLLVLEATNWRYGINHMRYWKTEDYRLTAAIRLIDVLEPRHLPNLHQFGDVTDILQRMRKDGQFDWIDFVPADDPSLGHLRVRHPLSKRWATLTRHSRAGQVDGYAYVKGGSRPADAVVFTWRKETAGEDERRIFDVTFPRPPTDYFRRSWLRKENREHYGRFSHQLDISALPPQKVLIEAHAMNLDAPNVRPMDGSFLLDLSGEDKAGTDNGRSAEP